ncbi:MAG TPA: GDSL-type esterase/lipase family protein [Fodinibius sp.]|nr:GDSL-type esterase/lipase family protein [Fodinibius sp.]
MKPTNGTLPLTILVALILSVSSSYAQTKEQKPDFGAYYYHKMTLFKELPNAEGEIIFLGDSITDGNEWAELFGNKRIKNRGISGDVTDGVLYRLEEVTESNPDKVFIMIGVNDLAGDRSVDYVVANYAKIVDRIKQASPQTQLYIQSILPVNDQFTQFPSHTDETSDIKEANQRLKKVAAAKGAVYIDLFDVMGTKDDKLNPDYTEDGLHLNGPGYLAWKAEVEKYIN